MLIGTLFVLGLISMFIGYVTRERLNFVSDVDPIATEIIEKAHFYPKLTWIPLYRHRGEINERYRFLITLYFWSSLAATILWAAAFAVYCFVGGRG